MGVCKDTCNTRICVIVVIRERELDVYDKDNSSRYSKRNDKVGNRKRSDSEFLEVHIGVKFLERLLNALQESLVPITGVATP
jgi:hypothetical protein